VGLVVEAVVVQMTEIAIAFVVVAAVDCFAVVFDRGMVLLESVFAEELVVRFVVPEG
jgi:hypothetical protein